MGSGHFAESLLILGLEGSRDDITRYGFSKKRIAPVSVEGSKEVDGTGARSMLRAGSSWRLNDSRPWKHTSNNRTEVRAGRRCVQWKIMLS